MKQRLVLAASTTTVVVSFLLILILSGCAAPSRFASPSENITGTYELTGFRIETAAAREPTEPGEAAPPYFTDLAWGATTTEEDVASYSGTLKVGRNTWTRQVTINDRSIVESGDFVMTFTGPKQAQIDLRTTTGERKTLRVTFENMGMTVEHPTVRLQDDSAINEVFMWRKVGGSI
jgi:hypothetical protein